MKGSYKINSVKFDFNMDSEDFALDINARWNSFYKTAFEDIVVKILDEFDIKNQYTQIDNLELDLGEIDEDNFDRLFPELLAEKLREKLTVLKIIEKDDNRIKQLNQKEHNYNAITYFLLHGYYPWYLQNRYVHFVTLFAEELKNNSVQLKQFLLNHGHYSSVKKRLIYQLNNDNLFEIVKVCNKSESSFIISYTTVLLDQTSYKEWKFSQYEDHRNAVWFVVLSYLFSNSESHFNRKEFIKHTINDLAAHYNLTYPELIQFLSQSMSTNHLGIFKSDLKSIINELFSESLDNNKSFEFNNPELVKVKQLVAGEIDIESFTESEFFDYTKSIKFKDQLYNSFNQDQLIELINKINSSAFNSSFKQYFEAEITLSIHRNIEKFIKEQAQFFKKKKNEPVPEFIKSEYIKLLKQPLYRRKLIESLNEDQTRKLVKVINPGESDFIITYALTLDVQKENNHFEGKAGSEFRQLKWEFLFTVLIEEHLSSFNRKKYILSVVSMLAAHYNLKAEKLLAYLYQSIISQVYGIPGLLKTIISELYFEQKGIRKVSQEINLVDKETQENYYAQILKNFIQTGFVSDSDFTGKIYANFNYLKNYRPDLLKNLLEELKHGIILFDQTPIPNHKELYRELIKYTIECYQISIPGGRNVKLFIENLADDKYKSTNIGALKTMLLALLKNDVDLFSMAWDLLTEREGDTSVLAKNELKFISDQQLLLIISQYDNSDFELFILRNNSAIFEKLYSSKSLFNKFLELCIYNQNILHKLTDLSAGNLIEFLRKSIQQFYPNQAGSIDFLFKILPAQVLYSKSYSIAHTLLKFAHYPKNSNNFITVLKQFIKLSEPISINSLLEEINEFELTAEAELKQQLVAFKKDLLNPQFNKNRKNRNNNLHFIQWIFGEAKSDQIITQVDEFYSVAVKNEFAAIVGNHPELVQSAIEQYFPDELQNFKFLIHLINNYAGSNKKKSTTDILVQFIYNILTGKSNYLEVSLMDIYVLSGINRKEGIINELDQFVAKHVLKKSIYTQINKVKQLIKEQATNINTHESTLSNDEIFFQWLNTNFGIESGSSKKINLPVFNLKNELEVKQFERLLIDQSQLFTTLLATKKISEVKLAQWVKSLPVSIQYRWLQVIPKSFYKAQIHDAYVLISWIKMYFNEHNLIFSETKINALLIDFCSGKLQNKSWQHLANMIIELCLKNIDTEKHDEFKLFIAQKAIYKGFDWESKIKRLYAEIENINNERKHKNDNNIQTKTTLTDYEESTDSLETIFINNAGLVLCSTYFPRLFEMLGLLNNGQLTNNKSKERAILILQYLVFENINFSESDMVLNKVLCGFNTGIPINTKVELNSKEKDTVTQLLNGIIQNWSTIGATSIEGLRGSFLIRDGKLEQKDDSWQLTIESKGYDMLIDRLPWSYTPIKHPWMNKPIHVKWR